MFLDCGPLQLGPPRDTTPTTRPFESRAGPPESPLQLKTPTSNSEADVPRTGTLLRVIFLPAAALSPRLPKPTPRTVWTPESDDSESGAIEVTARSSSIKAKSCSHSWLLLGTTTLRPIATGLAVRASSPTKMVKPSAGSSPRTCAVRDGHCTVS